MKKLSCTIICLLFLVGILTPSISAAWMNFWKGTDKISGIIISSEKFTTVSSASYTASIEEVQGGYFLVTAATVITLPLAKVGYNFYVINKTTSSIYVDPNIADRLWYNGTDTGTNGDRMSMNSHAAALCTAPADGQWECTCLINTCADGGAT